MKSRLAILIAVIAAFAALAPMASAKGGGTVREIALLPSASFPAADGKAKYKVDGNERELQIEVEDIQALAGQHVKVFVDGVKIGSPLVNQFGTARLKRDTGRGQAVPQIVTGSTVQVRTTGGTLIVSGSF